MSRFDVIAFDADDTLWHNEQLYIGAQTMFKDLLSQYHNPDWIAERLYQTEMRNLTHFGYGIKAFALSMIETAVELTEGRITGADIQTMIDAVKTMLAADITLIDNVADTLVQLGQTYELMVITKGDLRDQELKLARSGLGDYFGRVEIVSDKTRDSYAALLRRHRLNAARFVMIGNSLRSDILPVLDLGAHAIYVPHELTWVHEHASVPLNATGFHQVEHVGMIPALLAELEQAAQPLSTTPACAAGGA